MCTTVVVRSAVNGSDSSRVYGNSTPNEIHQKHTRDENNEI